MENPVRWRRQCAPIWGAAPPPPRVRKYEKVRIIGTAVAEFFILSDALEETFTHYVDGRTVFCSGEHSGCWLDHALVGKPRYGAWLAVQETKVAIVKLLRLTSVAVATDNRLRLDAGKLRGRRLQVWRVHPHEASEMHCKLFEPHAGELRLQPAPDVRYCVERMLAADDRPKHPDTAKWRPLSDAYKETSGAAAAAK